MSRCFIHFFRKYVVAATAAAALFAFGISAAHAQTSPALSEDVLLRYPILRNWHGFAPGAAGDRLKVGIALFNYQDKQLQSSQDQIWQTLFGASNSVEDLYQEASYGRVSFAPTYLGTFHLPFKGSEKCVSVFDPFTPPQADSSEQIYAAAAEAMAHGVDFSPYDRVVLFVPDYGSYCKRISVGLAMGNGKGIVLIYGSENAPPFPPSSATPRLMAHEFGHPFPLAHGTDITGDYGDWSCAMGGVNKTINGVYAPQPLVHFCAAHKYQLGWLSDRQVINLDGRGGKFKLGAVSNPGALPVVIRIPIPFLNRHYYISYRAPIGYDANLESKYRNRVQIHSFLDSVPPVNGVPMRDAVFLHTSLRKKQKFTDKFSGFSVKVTSVKSNSATVQVKFLRKKKPRT